MILLRVDDIDDEGQRSLLDLIEALSHLFSRVTQAKYLIVGRYGLVFEIAQKNVEDAVEDYTMAFGKRPVLIEPHHPRGQLNCIYLLK